MEKNQTSAIHDENLLTSSNSKSTSKTRTLPPSLCLLARVILSKISINIVNASLEMKDEYHEFHLKNFSFQMMFSDSSDIGFGLLARVLCGDIRILNTSISSDPLLSCHFEQVSFAFFFSRELLVTNTHSSLKEVSLSFPGIKTTTSLLGLAHLVKYSKQSSSYKTKSNNPDKSNAIADLIFRCNVSQFSLNILDVLDCQDLRLVSSGIAIKREPEISSLRDADHCTNPSAFFALTSLKLQVANESILSVDDLKLTAHCFSPCLNVPNSISFFVRKFCMVFFPLSIDSAVVILKFMTEVTLLRNIHDQSHHEQNFQDLDSSFNQSSDLVKAQSQNFEFDFFVETLVISLGGNDDHHLLETFVQSVGTRLLYKRNLNFSTNFFVEKIESFYDRGAVLLDIPNVSLQLEASPHHASKFVLEAKSSFDSVNWIIDHDTFSNLLENFKSIDWDQVEQLRIILEKKADGSQQGNKADSSVLIKHVENFKLNIQCKQMKIIIASPGINSRKEHLCLCLRSMNADVTRKSFDEAEFLHYELDGLVSEFLVEHQISGEHFDISADKSESKVPWLVSVPSAHLSLLLLQSKSLALRPSIFKFDCEIPELALNLGITRMCSFYIMKAQFISLVDSFQKLLIKGKGSYMNKHSTDKSDSKLSTEINVHIQSLSLRIETYEDQYLFICSKDIDLHPKTSEIDLFSSSGQMEVLGSTIANWTECKANFVKFNTSLVKHSKDTYCPPPMSFQNIQLEFGVLDVTLNDSVFLGDFIELSLLSLTALQQFDAKLKMSSVKPWSKSPKTLDFGELSLYSKKFSFQLRNDPIESVLLIKRKLSLQQSLREFEDYLSKSYQYAKYIEMHDSHLQFPSFTDIPENVDFDFVTDGQFTSDFISILRTFHKSSKYSNLARISSENFSIKLCQDPMYSSYESIINFVQEKDSSEFKPYLCQDINSNPVEKFSRLWLRKLVFRCSHLQVLIRDFPLPLLKSDFLEVSGFISMAQLHCPEKFLVIVPWSLHDDIIENVCSGSVVPQKIYHSLKIVASGVFFSYGYSLDSHIEMFSRALGRLSMLVAPGTQKFQPVDDLKWWDKFRYKYHGDIEFDIRDLCFKFLVTSIPYEVECIDLQSSHLVLSSRTGIIEANFSAFQLSFQRSERIARSPLPALDSYWKVIQKYRSDYYNLGITNPLFPVMCLIDLKVCFEFDWICGKKDILYASHYVHHVPEIKDDDCTFLQNFDLYHYFRAVDMNSKMIIRFRPCSDFGNNKSQFRIWMDDVHWFKVIQQAITTPPFTSRVIPVFRDRDGAFSLPVGKRSSITTSSIIHSMEIQVDIKDAELQMFHFDKSNELMGISLSIKNFKYHLTLYHPRETTEAERMWFYLDHNVLIENVRSKILVSQKVDPSEENRALRDQLIIREQNPFSNSEEEDEDSERLLVFGTHASMNDLNGNSKHGGELRTSFLISRQSFFFSLSQLTYLSPSFTASSLSPRNPGHQKESSLDYCEASSARESRHNSVHDFLRMALASTDLSNSGNFLSPKTPSLNQSRDSNESLLESPQSKPNFARRDRNLRPSGELESKVFVRDLKVLYSVPVRKSSSYWFDYFMVSQYSDPIKDSDSFKATDTELHPDKTKFQTKENQSAGPIEDSSFSNDPAFFDSNKVERGSFETSKYLKFKTVDVPHSDESRISDDSLMSINSRYRRLYTFEFSRPQVNLCSSETKGRMVLIAHTAKVETGAFALPDLLPQLADIAEDFEKDTADSGFREIIARKSPDLEFFKRTLFITLSKAQLLVAPIGIDMSLSAHWVPHKYFKSLNEDKKKAHSPHTTGLLEEITAPTVISFRYEYDTELPLIYSQTSERLQELFFRLNYSATSGDGEFELSKAGLDLDLGDRRRLVEILGKFLVPTSRMSIRFSPLDCFMTGRQFRTLVGVAHSLFIDPVGEEKDAIFAEIVPTKEQMISEILKIFKLHQELKNEPSTAWGIQKASELTTRKVEYIIESARIVLEDHTLAIPLDSVNHSGGKEERSGGFVVASLTGLHGVHQFYFNNSSNMFLEIEDLTLEDKVNGKIVFSKTISFEDQILISRMIPGASPLSKKEPLLRVFADACPPLLTDKVKSSREDEHINTAGSVTPALAAVTAWERFEIKLVPIQIDFSQDLYGVLRRYFFPVEYEHDSTFLPPPNPSNSTSYRNSFVSTGPNNQISLRNSASMSRKNSTREISIVSTKSAREPVEIPFTNYFKYLRINRVDIMASFQGFITFEDLQLRLEPFSANGKLWNWDKVVTKFEKHVRANVLGQATGIVKHTLGIGKSSQESRRRSRTPSKDTLLSINETRKYEPSLSAIDDSQTLEYSESKGQSFQHSEQEAEKLSQKRKSNALKKLMKRMGMSGTSGEKHQPQYDDDFEDASLSELR